MDLRDWLPLATAVLAGSVGAYLWCKRNREILPPSPPPYNWLLGLTNFSHAPYFSKPDLHRYATQWANDLGSVYLVYIRGPTYVVTDAQLVGQILARGDLAMPKHDELYSLTNDLLSQGHMQLFSEADESSDIFRGYRKGMAPSFSVENLKKGFPTIRACAEDMIQQWGSYLARGEPVDVHSWMNRVTLEVIGRIGFQYEFNALQNEHNKFIDAMHENLAELSRQLGDPLRPVMNKLFPFTASAKQVTAHKEHTKALFESVYEALKRRGTPPADDQSIGACLMRIRNPSSGQPFPEETVLANLTIMLIAGYDTTSATCLTSAPSVLLCKTTAPAAAVAAAAAFIHRSGGTPQARTHPSARPSSQSHSLDYFVYKLACMLAWLYRHVCLLCIACLPACLPALHCLPSCLPACFARLPALPAHPALPACLPCPALLTRPAYLPALPACFACLLCLPALPTVVSIAVCFPCQTNHPKHACPTRRTTCSRYLSCQTHDLQRVSSDVRSWALYDIARHPEVQRRIAQELAEAGLLQVAGQPKARQLEWGDLAAFPYFNAAIKESMRLHPAASTGTFRKSTKEVVLGGWRIPKGGQIWVPFHSMHNSNYNFTKPEVFDPERWLVDAPKAASGVAAGATHAAGAAGGALHLHASVGPDASGPAAVGAAVPASTPANGTAAAAAAGQGSMATPHGHAGVPLSKAILPFSDGTRGCIGMNLAYADVRTIMLSVLSSFWLELDPSVGTHAEVEAAQVMALVLTSGKTIKLRLQNHAPASD